MNHVISRRDVLKGALGLGGLVMASTWMGRSVSVLAAVPPTSARLRILHLTDFHWGYQGVWNRHLQRTFERILLMAKSATPAFDLILVTGDLIQATLSSKEREARLNTVKERLDSLHIPWRAIPGEHDTFGDQGSIFEKTIGPLTFHENFFGLHLIGLDNVSRGYFLGRDQVSWLRREAASSPPGAPALVLSHAPLYDLFTPWNWYTLDGAQAYSACSHLSHRLFLFGHVHQLASSRQGQAMSYSGLPTSWPLPQPGPMERLSPWPQGATNPDMGLGFRVIEVSPQGFSTQVFWLASLTDATGMVTG